MLSMNNSTSLKVGNQKYSLSERTDLLVEIAELLEQGMSSTKAIQERFGISRPTAIAYRNEAMKLVTKDNTITRSNLRALEEGRLKYWIEWLQEKINKAYNEGDKEHATKLLQRLEGFSARYHRITGLEEITINSQQTSKRIVFHVNSTTKPQTITSEGELTDNSKP